MKYNELVIERQKKARRVGRGISAGRGKTAGRGTKGQGSRKSPVRYGFEGGQNPLYARLPKLRGFKSHRRPVETVYTGQLEALKKPAIDAQVLHAAGLISSPYVKVKLIVKGELKSKKVVQLQVASAQAVKLIESAGGSFSKVDQVARSAKKAAKPTEK